MPQQFILIINAGSSSLKFKLFSTELREIAEGIVEKIGLDGSFLNYGFSKKGQRIEVKVKDHHQAMEAVVDSLRPSTRSARSGQAHSTMLSVDFKSIVKVGHRVVHGAEKFIRPTLLTARTIKQLEKFNKLAPLHNPNNIAGIKACRALLPAAEQWAVFDTAFHSTIPDYAYLYPIPFKIYQERGVRRYGFHGISHQYVSGEASRLLKKKFPNLITCHLGSGCSITAIKAGKSVDTSMGFTPLEGLMMSTRSGDIDPAIIFYLTREGMTITEIDKLLNSESGLVGVAGLKDMRDIMVASGYKISNYRSPLKFSKQQKYLASLALNMFVYRVRKYIGAYATVLGRIDAIVFTAGIGERNADIRSLIVKGLPIKTKILVIPTNEELMIAKLISNT
ncbi:acetate kinase [Candidatus Falkowbacteria bacterium]|nr:acetate kinase [Candidatus Falkowbacteria bacterium]